MTAPTTGVQDPFTALEAEMDALNQRLLDTGGLRFEPLRDVVLQMFARGGKRIRPRLVFASCRLSAPPRDKTVSLAAAVETLHAATLVHDDLVDGASRRRGQPTINTRWSAGATVLAGDWLFARAARFAADTGNVRVMDIFARTLQTLANGELRQLFGRTEAPSLEEYEARIYAKTAALFEASTEMGGVLAGQSEPVIEALATFGRELGMAFQIVDDILDFVGEPGRLGKPVGSDLRTGTFTLPAILHLEHHDGHDWNGDGPTPEERDDLVAAVAQDQDALSRAWEVARTRRAVAHEALMRVPPGEARELLDSLARHAVDRDS